MQSWTAMAYADPATMRHHLVDHGDAMIALSKDYAPGAGIVSFHAYSVVKVYQKNSTWNVWLRNPWAVDGRAKKAADGNNNGYVSVTWSEFRANFQGYASV